MIYSHFYPNYLEMIYQEWVIQAKVNKVMYFFSLLCGQNNPEEYSDRKNAIALVWIDILRPVLLGGRLPLVS